MEKILRNKFRFLGISIVLFGFILLLLSNEPTNLDWVYLGGSALCLIILNIFYFYLFNKSKKYFQDK
ncbi:MAG: hypothetical protein J7J86_05550 [Bacteroidales bacterium]|nr:hypothetical protein [Bacteroidales bacterium]